MAEPQLRSFTTRETLDAQLADEVAHALRTGIEERGAALLVVSGGSTPVGFFRALSGCDLDWPRVTITLADDRWVPPAHADSNERLVRENLMTGAAAEARFVPLVSSAPHPEQGLADAAAALAPMDTADVTILGMGGDAHFASLFPGTPPLAAGLDLANAADCIAVEPLDAPHPRISMTLRRIFDTRSLVLHIVGEDKLTLLERARAADPMELPIAAVLAATDPAATVYWAP